MRIIAVLILVYLIFGCAATVNNTARHFPITESNGSKSYLITQQITGYAMNKATYDGVMNTRANFLCPVGYSILNQDAYDVTFFGGYGTELVWQIRCTT